jgi:hypothetical protein
VAQTNPDRRNKSENSSFWRTLNLRLFFTFAIANPRVLFSLTPLPPKRGGEVLFGEGPLHPIPGQLEAFLAHGNARQLSLHPQDHNIVCLCQVRRTEQM